MKENIIKNKTFDFSLQIIELYKKLVAEKEFIISKQLLKYGTSIGANVFESEATQSRLDFISKLSIAFKEAREAEYWLLLFLESQLVKLNLKLYLNNIIEIKKILTSIIKTSQENQLTPNYINSKSVLQNQ